MKINKSIIFLSLALCLLLAKSVFAASLTDVELVRLLNSDKQSAAPVFQSQAPLQPQNLSLKWSGLKTKYIAGDLAKINFIISNQTGQAFTGSVSAFYISPSVPAVLKNPQAVSLSSGKTFSGSIDAGQVSELFDPGKITFIVRLLDEQNRVINEFNTSSVIATKPPLTLRIDTGNKKVFNKGEAVSFKIVSPKNSAPKLSIKIKDKKGKIIFKQTKSFSWTPSAIGVYTVEIFGSDSRFKPYSDKIQIAVIDKNKIAGAK